MLCLIVDGEPYATDKPDLGQEECFPEASKAITAISDLCF